MSENMRALSGRSDGRLHCGMAEEVPSYPRLQEELVAAVEDRTARRVLDLGTGTGITARLVLRAQPEASLVGLDESADMLAAAREILPAAAELRVGLLEDPMPPGPFDLIMSVLAVHHLDGPGKADLFRRVTEVLEPGGRFVLGDVIVPEDPHDVVTPIDGTYDTPSTLAEQLTWLDAAGLAARATWVERDLAVLVGDLPLS